MQEGKKVEEYKKMLAGKDYNPMTPYLISLRDRTRGLVSDFNQEKDEKKRLEILEKERKEQLEFYLSLEVFGRYYSRGF